MQQLETAQARLVEMANTAQRSERRALTLEDRTGAAACSAASHRVAIECLRDELSHDERSIRGTLSEQSRAVAAVQAQCSALQRSEASALRRCALLEEQLQRCATPPGSGGAGGRGDTSLRGRLSSALKRVQDLASRLEREEARREQAEAQLWRLKETLSIKSNRPAAAPLAATPLAATTPPAATTPLAARSPALTSPAVTHRSPHLATTQLGPSPASVASHGSASARPSSPSDREQLD